MVAVKSPFELWILGEDDRRDWDDITPTEQMRLAWNAAITAAANECTMGSKRRREAHWQQMAYACRCRIEKLRSIP